MNAQNPTSSSHPKSKSIPLPSLEEKYVKLLGGPPDTAGIITGCVVLAPGESIGLHSTKDHEEVIVPLSGSGELKVPGMETIQVNPGCVLYNPPHTQHDVINTGDQPLRYIFIVAKA